jgi:hypothetical protein
MTAATLPCSTRSELLAAPANGSRQAKASASPGGEPPSAVGEWSLTPFAAGWWLSGQGRELPPAVRLLRPEPGRLGLVIDADGPDDRTDRLLSELSPVLSAARVRAVRLMLSSAVSRYATDEGLVPGIDLIMASGRVVITPHGYALVRGHGPAASGSAQWCRRLADGQCRPTGMLAPSPEWESGLAAGMVAGLGPDLRLHRVPAGLALTGPGRDAWVASAGEMWPDPERPVIIVDRILPAELTRHALTGLLTRLAPLAEGGVRLCWPRAGTRFGALLRDLAGQTGVDLIAPAADVSRHGFGGISRGPEGAAPWLLFGCDGNVSTLGSLYPESAWEQALAGYAPTGRPADLTVEDVAAGLCVYRAGPSVRGLVATARSILPDPGRITIIAAGDAGDDSVRQDVRTVLGRLPDQTRSSVRLLLTGAGAGGEDSYAQSLADVLSCEIIAPAGRWTATPNGRARALPAPGCGSGPRANGWCVFVPHGAGNEVPLATAAVEPGPPSPAPVPPAPARSGPAITSPAVPGVVAMLPREHRSTAADRAAYRESAEDFHAHSVSVRQMMTQRPGLRSATAAESLEAVATDFAAVIDCLSDDRHATVTALRAAGTAGDPRVACMLSGLRRLPSFTGAVFTSASLSGDPASAYAAGQVLVERAFVEGSSSCQALLGGEIEYVIWSQTGKRTAALVAGAGRDEVIFAAGTSYRVLYVDPPISGRLLRVFLRELTISPQPGDPAAVPAPGTLDATDRKLLERLRSAAALRDSAAASDQARTGRPITASLVGLNDHGYPFS